MHFIFGKYVVLLLKTLLITDIVIGGNFHDFDSPCERIHYRCRTNIYPFPVTRLVVPDKKVKWEYVWPNYKPPVFTAISTVGQRWADADLTDKTFNPQWNSVDGPINRKSYVGIYNICEKHPVNPIGRTGLAGRGVLGRWGPNHAADSVVTRWKRNEKNEITINPISQKPILQLVIIQKINGEWGIPGGMVNPGENVSAAGKREFFEEVLPYKLDNSVIKCKLDNFFKGGIEIYKGYVDDPRNTDNAWVESVVFHYHDADGKLFKTLKLMAGDDAHHVAWKDVDRDIKLYAAHQKFIHEMTTRLKAHF